MPSPTRSSRNRGVTASLATRVRRTTLAACAGAAALGGLAVLVPSGAAAADAPRSSSPPPRAFVPEGRYLGDLRCDRATIRVYSGSLGARFELCEPSGRPVAEPLDRHALFERHAWLRLERFEPNPAEGLAAAFKSAIAARP